MSKVINFNPLSGKFDYTESATTVVTVDTKANILALTPDDPTTALATDTGEFFVYDGTDWKVASIALATEEANPDAGWTQDNDKQGYGEDYINNKKATNFAIGAFNDTPYEGAVRVRHDNSPKTASFYLDSQWQDIPLDISFADDNYTHLPAGSKVDIRSGNSQAVGLNGIPYMRDYKTDAGCYPRAAIIDGGTLT